MADGDIWISAIANNSDLLVGIEIDREDQGWRAKAEGRAVRSEDLPFRLYGKYRDAFFEQGIPDIFFGPGGIKISENLHSVFASYNLGVAKMYPASLYLHDRNTLVTPSLYILGVREDVEAFVPEQCQNVGERYKHRSQAKPSPETKWKMPYTLQDGDIAVLPSKSEGLDFWSDKWLDRSLFFSDPLKQALCEGGYAKIFDFKKCKKAVLH